MKKLRLFCLALMMLVPTTSHAQIAGFNFLDGWTLQQSDSGLPPAVGEDFIDITNGGSQQRNIWFNTPQNIDAFTASFRYQATDTPFNPEGGISFIIHANASGLDTSSSGAFGFAGIDSSVGITIELDNNGPQTRTGVFSNGVIGTGSTDISSFSPLDGFDVSIDYDGRLLTLGIENGVNTPFERTTIISPDFATILNSNNAIVGFGASNSNIAGSSNFTQTISNFRFSSSSAIPEPSPALILAGLSCVAGLSWRRRRQ